MPRTTLTRPALAGPTARHAVAAAVGVVALLGTAGCAADAAADGAGGTLAASDPLPSTVPDGTTLVVGDPTTEVALELAGDEIEHDLSFDLEWANLSGGPQTIEAFRAESLDVGAVAEIPPIHATWTGVPVSIVATQYRENWQDAPVYELAGRPGLTLGSLDDLAGKRIAFSPGQAQGALVLKALGAAGLTQDDVELVELPSTGDVYSTALAAGEVDVAPLGGTQLFRYLTKYEADGAQSVRHGLRDDAGHLYAPKAVLEDPAKAAALHEYVEVWAKAKVWVAEHPEEWKQGYYVEHEGLTDEDAQYLIDHAAVPDIPADLTEGIARTQDTIDLLSTELGEDPLDAADLFDQRFVAAQTAGVEAQRAAEEGR
ncbi:ABC transporter substrate-binding protein [Krasilnikoviella flava]|uniref:Sulfonate transport system substrate-binding protein n=1 Tax=Krasilnikoviella flava TaxID=526729 RepID=A0A1T5LF34_9MICO|nr:ABC transporter substrate-binding protein [Krasilnikoviella flava]SKC74611.1 sulfonate transport system substrate-binding protein [Krasilnikoviella flava]